MPAALVIFVECAVFVHFVHDFKNIILRSRINLRTGSDVDIQWTVKAYQCYIHPVSPCLSTVRVNTSLMYSYTRRSELAWPGFQLSTIPLPFFRSVATIAAAGENGNAGNAFPYT